MNDLVTLMDVRVRAGDVADLGYVIDTWGRSLRAEYPDMRTTEFVGQLRAGIKRRLDAGAVVRVAHPAEDNDLILGWIALGQAPAMVHYVYVRESHRRGGIARLLGLTGEICVDAMTNALRRIRRAHPDTIHYLPAI